MRLPVPNLPHISTGGRRLRRARFDTMSAVCSIRLSFAISSMTSAPAWKRAAPAPARRSNGSPRSTRSGAPLLPTLENLKRDRNQAGEQIAKAKRAGEDASALLDANKARAEEIKRLDASMEAIEAERQQLLLRLPNVPHASVPVGKSAEDNQVVRQHGQPPRVRLRAEAALGARRRARHPRFRARRPHVRRALLRADGRRRASRPRAHRLHARSPHARARLHRSRAAVPGQQPRR